MTQLALKRSLILMLLSLIFISLTIQAKEKIHVAFISPDPGTSEFWTLYEKAMMASAQQFDIHLEVIHSPVSDRFGLIEKVEAVTSRPNKPDFLVTVFKFNQTHRLLNMVEKSGIKFIASSSNIPPDVQVEIDAPRKNYKSWLAHLIQDDLDAGWQLAKSLAEVAKSKNMPLHFAGLSGSRDSTVAFGRNRGLTEQVKSQGAALAAPIFFTNWRLEEAIRISNTVKLRYPNTRLFWCASDAIAAGVIDVYRREIADGKVLVGGIDWSLRGIDLFETKQLVTSIGGHFLEGAIILALIHDYMQGIDFEDELGVNIPLKMTPLSAENVAMIKAAVVHQHWRKFDFTRLSKAQTGGYQSWATSYEAILENIYIPEELSP